MDLLAEVDELRQRPRPDLRHLRLRTFDDFGVTENLNREDFLGLERILL